MDTLQFEKGDVVSFIKGGMKQNGTVEFILDTGDVVVKVHVRYKDDEYYVFNTNQLQKLLED
jgi:hypothetical protein